jgi:hypothetical protein
MFAAGRRGGTGLGSAGLEPVIRPEALRHALHATGRVNPRACKLIPEVVLWVVLAMGLFTELLIRQVFKHARRLSSVNSGRRFFPSSRRVSVRNQGAIPTRLM